MNPKVVVKESELHGKGLFAGEVINKGQLIGKVKGRKTRKDGPHVLWLDNDDDCAVGIHVTCSLKYINHSKQANVCYLADRRVLALKDIRVDEELTHDYGDDWN